MIRKLRVLVFYFIAMIGTGIVLFASLVLTKDQIQKVKEVLESVSKALEEEDKQFEPTTIEDEIFHETAQVYHDMYRKGTNEDLSVECRMCGANTKRGEYYARGDVMYPDEQLPYLVICPDCYNKLPYREKD